jgi:hypothetical protein
MRNDILLNDGELRLLYSLWTRNNSQELRTKIPGWQNNQHTFLYFTYKFLGEYVKRYIPLQAHKQHQIACTVSRAVQQSGTPYDKKAQEELTQIEEGNREEQLTKLKSSFTDLEDSLQTDILRLCRQSVISKIEFNALVFDEETKKTVMQKLKWGEESKKNTTEFLDYINKFVTAYVSNQLNEVDELDEKIMQATPPAAPAAAQSLEAQIAALKVQAVELKQAGKVQEAVAVLRQFKALQVQLDENRIKNKQVV